MAWQDELKNLDDDLSSGRITADEHRKRRDEILAAASSNPAKLRRRLQRQQTNSIANAFGGDPNAPAPAPTRQATEGREERGENVPQGRPGEDPAWAATMPDTVARATAGAPRASSWQPTILPAPRPDHPPLPKQGEEVFDRAGSGSSKWVWLVAVVAVLAVVAGGLWWFTSGSTDSSSVAAPPQGRSQFTLAAVPNPTDLPLSTSGVLTVDQAQIYNLLKPDEAAYLTNGGTERIYYRGVTAGNLVYHVFAFQPRDPNGARPLATSIVEHNKTAGMTEAAVPNLPSGVLALKVLGENAAIYEAIYPADGVAVRIMVVQNGQTDENLLADTLKRTVNVTVDSITPK